MIFNKITFIIASIAMISACGSGDKATTPAAASAVVETEWVDSPADGKLLFNAAVDSGSETAQILLKAITTSEDPAVDLGAKFVSAMMGTYEQEYTTIQKEIDPGNIIPLDLVLAQFPKTFDLNLKAKIKILNLLYTDDGQTMSEVDCPEQTMNFGQIAYSEIPTSIDLTVKQDMKISCKGSDGKTSYYVYIYKDQNINKDEGFELKFDFQQRAFIGKMYIKDKAESISVYGKTLYFTK